MKIKIIGGGLAGSEAAYHLAKLGYDVILYEMRPNKMTGAHSTSNLAELVCSNSLKSSSLTNACGILKEEMLYKPFTGMIHCFSSSEQLAKTAIDLGMYISLSGIITFKKSQELRDIFKTIPLDRLLIETDAPYLAPEPYRGQINESVYVSKVLEKLAEIKDISPQELDKITTQNFMNLFKKVREKI